MSVMLKFINLRLLTKLKYRRCLLIFNMYVKIPFTLQYLIKVNEIKTKKGVDLLQNLIKYYHAQCK